MASIQSVAITRQQAYASLAETTRMLAAQFGIEAPAFDIHKRHPLEYRQAQELQRIAAFLEKLAAVVNVESTTSETPEPVKPAAAKAPARSRAK